MRQRRDTEKRDVDLQNCWRGSRLIDPGHNAGSGAGGDFQSGLLRVFLSQCELPKQRARQSLHRSQLLLSARRPAWMVERTRRRSTAQAIAGASITFGCDARAITFVARVNCRFLRFRACARALAGPGGRGALAYRWDHLDGRVLRSENRAALLHDRCAGCTGGHLPRTACRPPSTRGAVPMRCASAA